MKDIDIEIKKIGIESIEDQLSVYRTAFNLSSKEDDDVKFWKKKHFSNPLGDSLIFGAFVDSNLVGINAFMPVLYKYNNKEYLMLQSCESGVDPKFQGCGIWKKLMIYALDYIKKNDKYSIVIGFPNYINSYPGFNKMNWATINNMSNYLMVNDISSFASLFNNKGWFLRKTLRLTYCQRIPIWLLGKFARNILIKPSEESQLLWNSDSKEVTCSHKDAILKWKCEYKKLHSILAFNREGTTPIASCLYELSEYENRHIIKIHKFISKSKGSLKEMVFLAKFLEYFSKEYTQVAFIRVWIPKDGNSSIWKKLFFIKSKHKNPFIINNPDSEFSKFKWNLSFYDLD